MLLKTKEIFNKTTIFKHACRSIVSSSSRLSIVKVELDKDVHEQLVNEKIKPRKHVGINKAKTTTLPTYIIGAMKKVAGDYSLNQLVENGQIFNRYLNARKVPIEKYDMKYKLMEFKELVEKDPVKYRLPETPPDPSNELATKFYEDMKKQRIQKLAYERIYAWQAIEYDHYKSLLYLFGRAPQEYAALKRIFQEIVNRNPEFKPRTFFDFGSGVGTGVWAASEFWKSSLYEYYLVDGSKYMNDLSDLILRDGNENKTSSLRNVFYRQFLPSREQTFDLVLSAYSMFEQETINSRLEIANNLWNKTAHDGFLVFIENGTNNGFKIIEEIRHFLTDYMKKNNEEAFIFSPCPHEKECPRKAANDGTPCNFEAKYQTLPFNPPMKIETHLYSYLVIKKSTPNDTSDRWPRVVRPTLIRCQHMLCRLCTNRGALEEAIFTKRKHEKFAYRCARHATWGDQYPANKLEIIDRKKSNELEENKEDEFDS